MSADEMIEAIESMDKDQLDEYAMATFGRDLDKRKRLEDLREEVKSLVTGETQRKEAEQLAAAEQAGRPRQPKVVRHVVNGRRYNWHPVYKGNADLEVVEWG